MTRGTGSDATEDGGLLAPHRRRIDEIDDRLVDLLAERFGIVREVAHLKREAGLAVVQAERALAVIERNAARAEAQGLDPDLVRRIWQSMIDTAHVIENRIVREGRGVPMPGDGGEA